MPTLQKTMRVNPWEFLQKIIPEAEDDKQATHGLNKLQKVMHAIQGNLKEWANLFQLSGPNQEGQENEDGH